MNERATDSDAICIIIGLSSTGCARSTPNAGTSSGNLSLLWLLRGAWPWARAKLKEDAPSSHEKGAKCIMESQPSMNPQGSPHDALQGWRGKEEN